LDDEELIIELEAEFNSAEESAAAFAEADSPFGGTFIKGLIEASANEAIIDGELTTLLGNVTDADVAFDGVTLADEEDSDHSPNFIVYYAIAGTMIAILIVIIVWLSLRKAYGRTKRRSVTPMPCKTLATDDNIPATVVAGWTSMFKSPSYAQRDTIATADPFAVSSMIRSNVNRSPAMGAVHRHVDPGRVVGTGHNGCETPPPRGVRCSQPPSYTLLA